MKRDVHVAVLALITVAPLVEHTGVVSDAKVTGKLDDAVALTVNGAAPNALLPKAPKVIVWLVSPTPKLWSMFGAAA